MFLVAYSAAMTVKGVAGRAKSIKRSLKSHETVVSSPGIGELAVKRAKTTNIDGTSVIKRQRFAMGGLDSDALGWTGGADTVTRGGKKARNKAKIEEFRGFDAAKANNKKTSKSSTNSFKTKKRFKRR
jgi:hypothetical protein